MLAGHLIVGAGGGLLGLPVGVVDLQLHELHVRVLGQKPVQQLRLVVEGKAVVLHKALRLLFLHKAPYIELVVFFDVALLQRV